MTPHDTIHLYLAKENQWKHNSENPNIAITISTAKAVLAF